MEYQLTCSIDDIANALATKQQSSGWSEWKRDLRHDLLHPVRSALQNLRNLIEINLIEEEYDTDIQRVIQQIKYANNATTAFFSDDPQVPIFYEAWNQIATAGECIEQLYTNTAQEQAKIALARTARSLQIAVYMINRMQGEQKEYWFRESCNALIRDLCAPFNAEGIYLELIFADNEFGSATFKTEADWTGRVVMPLIYNAAEHAFKEKQDNKIIIGGARDSKGYILIVRDNGCGISEEIMPHIFEDGFTTKEDAAEHGHGLYAVWKFIEEQRGTIRVYSKPKQGTAFISEFPI